MTFFSLTSIKKAALALSAPAFALGLMMSAPVTEAKAGGVSFSFSNGGGHQYHDRGRGYREHRGYRGHHGRKHGYRSGYRQNRHRGPNIIIAPGFGFGYQAFNGPPVRYHQGYRQGYQEGLRQGSPQVIIAEPQHSLQRREDFSRDNCREYQSESVVGGRVVETYGEACQQQDGTWRIVSETPRHFQTLNDR